ncbi:sulfite exporter TauE/SafE family protein [Bradyrhizobium sp. LMG 9283]|uniref:sulfite exporter TauE/SafE family protein n=1 Tax=Bradyrhizobium sp. LMG 9283 TaxID=592064 RepID=UPI0038908F19
MDFVNALILIGAGFLGGVMNALAGGATLLTFPAMLWTGLPPVVATASNALAVTPGHTMAAIADRAMVPWERSVVIGLILATIGGVGGALLLLATSERFFTLLVPALIAAATILFGLGPRLQRLTASRSHARGARNSWLLPVAIYGGYFGAGLGVMLLALLTLTGKESLRTLNALKNLYATVAALAGVVIFALSGTINWPSTFVMLTGALAGGFVGGKLVGVLPAVAVRGAIVALGAVMTAAYAWRFWFA